MGLGKGLPGSRGPCPKVKFWPLLPKEKVLGRRTQAALVKGLRSPGPWAQAEAVKVVA